MTRTELYTADGTQVTKEDIRKAVAQRRAVIRWSHGDGYNSGCLLILETAEDAILEAERRTIGQCYSMWEEVWSGYPATVGEAIRAAAGLLKAS